MNGFCVWITGIPCSGKTTIAKALAAHLRKAGYDVLLLDGDTFRGKYHPDLGFSKEDRDENIRRAAIMAHQAVQKGRVAVCAFVSPYRQARNFARTLIGLFYEVFLDCPVEVCMERDSKGLYARAKAGEIRGLTGYDAPYEEPRAPEMICNTATETLEQCVEKILSSLHKASSFSK